MKNRDGMVGAGVRIAGWTLQLKGEVLEKMEKLKDINQQDYNKLVEETAERYGRVKRVTASELAHMEATQKHFFARVGLNKEEESKLKSDQYFEASLFDLITAFTKVLKEIPRDIFHEVIKDEFTVSEKIHDILHLLVDKPVIFFAEIFKAAKNKTEIITTFLALLELIRLKEVCVRQSDAFEDIEIVRNVETIKPQPVKVEGDAGN